MGDHSRNGWFHQWMSSIVAIVMGKNTFAFAGERFADLQMLRYRLNGFEQLSLQQKKYVYYL